MKQELLDSFKCEYDRYWNTFYPLSRNQNKNYRKKLIENDYDIVEPKSDDKHRLTYKTSERLFMNIINKYDLNNTFNWFGCFDELMKLNECSIMQCGNTFSLYDRNTDFIFRMTFSNVSVLEYGFKDNRIVIGDKEYAEKCSNL